MYYWKNTDCFIMSLYHHHHEKDVKYVVPKEEILYCNNNNLFQKDVMVMQPLPANGELYIIWWPQV